jgi:hypothetical protein
MEMVDKFYEHEKYACIYYAYNTIQKYLVSGSDKFLGAELQIYSCSSWLICISG